MKTKCFQHTVAITISGDGDALLPRLPAFKIYQHYVKCFETLVSSESLKTTIIEKDYSPQDTLKEVNLTKQSFFTGNKGYNLFRTFD